MKRPEIRFLSDMRKVLYDQKWAKGAKNFPVYYIYRGLKKRGDLRYDITVLLPRMLGKEFPKTLGHEHSKGYQELYRVLAGKAIFLIQKVKGKEIIDVRVIKAKGGDWIIVPPGYGHITINPSKEILKVGNFVSQKCKNIYNLFKRRQGGCYYYTRSGWIKNKNYKRIPELRFKKALKKFPKNLSFLKR